MNIFSPGRVYHIDNNDLQRFSRRPEIVDAIKNDPLRKPEGTLKGLSDMVTQVRSIIVHMYVLLRSTFAGRRASRDRLQTLAPRSTRKTRR